MRVPTVWATIVGSFSQWIVLIVGGGWALVLALAKGWIDIHPNLLYLSIVLATIVTAALLMDVPKYSNHGRLYDAL